MNTMLLIFAAFATYRISSILVAEDGKRGPWDIIYRLHLRIGIQWDPATDSPSIYPVRFLPQLLSCIGCTSVWVGAALATVYLLLPEIVFSVIVLPFGLSGAAMLIDSMIYKS